MIDPSSIAITRLASQQVSGSAFTKANEIVRWMGAMQSQEYAMAKWAIGVRLPGTIETDIDQAIDQGEIIRIHAIRPTWHFVAAEDVYWLLDLTGAQIIAAQSSRDRVLELSDEIYSKSNATLEKALSGRRHLTREELVAALKRVGIRTNENRASHLFARAEADKIVCSGVTRNGKHTYALLSERVKQPKVLGKDEALAELARRFFTSRCPATLQDFTWWSGLPVRHARQALELVKSSLHQEKIGEKNYWLPENFKKHDQKTSSFHFLPPYDEFLISYSDRSASITMELEQHMKTISNRGIFRPILVFNGQVIGVWKRLIQKETIILELQPFIKMEPALMESIDRAARQYGTFMKKEIILRTQ